jgi:LacI family transcriptional regulator
MNLIAKSKDEILEATEFSFVLPPSTSSNGSLIMQSRSYKVALVVETSKSYGRGILQGINRYTKENETWSIYLMPQLSEGSSPTWLRNWKGDGIIARLSDPKVAQAILRAELPTVNLGLPLPNVTIPCVQSNPRSIARIVARHFLERGFRNFGFCGDKQSRDDWSPRVASEFRSVLRHAGHHGYDVVERCLGNLPTDWEDWDKEQVELGRWISRLPKPIGVFAINDSIGMQVLEACHQIGAAIPDHVAVLGLENDELVCSLASPPLSSVSINAEMIGYRAAQLLDDLMRGVDPSKKTVTVEPISVVTRQSTDVQGHVDEIVAKAVRFIRNWAPEGINVDDVLREVNVSRSSLDRRFKAALGRTPHEEIVRAQLNVAMQLLTDTDFNLTQIAIKSGFKHAAYMGAVFRRELNMTAGQYRQFCDSAIRQV